jgi:hypothetical protein
MHFHGLFLFLLQPFGREPLVSFVYVPDVEPVSRLSVPDVDTALLFVLDIDQVLIEKRLLLELFDG